MATNLTFARNQQQEPGDREAPYKLKFEHVELQDKTWGTEILFKQRNENTQQWHILPPGATFERRLWEVGLAINHHATIDTAASAFIGGGTHWGVFLRPITSRPEEHPYRIVGLNFRDATRKEFILGQKWRTLDRGYQIQSSRADFDTKDKFQMQVTCSFEEFIFLAQSVLRSFQQHNHLGILGEPRGGDAYNIFINNCQTFALQFLKEMKDRDWADIKRGKIWKLDDFKADILLGIRANSSVSQLMWMDNGYEEHRQAMFGIYGRE